MKLFGLIIGCISAVSSAEIEEIVVDYVQSRSINTLLGKVADYKEKLLRNEFGSWKESFGKSYGDEDEEVYRMNIWKTSKLLVEKHNQQTDVTYELEMNEFADMTPEEFARMFLMDLSSLNAPQYCSATTSGWKTKTNLKLPEFKDWREQNMVSPVKNQGKCGSCYTFSSTGCLEAHIAIKTGKKLLFSEQQILDCAQAFDNHGCQGGLPSHVFEFIKYNHGLETESEYPYKAKQNPKCMFTKSAPDLGFVKDSVNITALDEESLTAAIATEGPVSVAFQVYSDFRLYKSGIYQSNKCGKKASDVNHAVLAVGYGTKDGLDYYIIKNSWGAKWGMDGYFEIKRGENECGIAMCASFPIV